jgi:hypothetical protein
MHANSRNPAVLESLRGPHRPPVALPVSADYQFCVDAGVLAGAGFLEDLALFCLHDHIAVSMRAFVLGLERAWSAPRDACDAWPASRRQACIDAFAAGYLGRIQQELQLFAQATEFGGGA